MELTGISFQNYKAFPGKESIEIRPLTILIGRNSSGKSAIARLPLLLGSSLSERLEAPVELDIDGVDFGASFVDLIHNRRPHGAIGLGATFEEKGERVELWARVQHFSDSMLQVVSELHVQLPGTKKYAFFWVGKDPVHDRDQYRVEVDGKASIETGIWFLGLFPRGFDDETRKNVFKDSEGFDPFIGAWLGMYGALRHIGYLGPFREAPQRFYRYPGGLPKSVGRAGVNAPALLGADALRRGRYVVEAVGEWYRENLGGWQLDVVQQGDVFSLVLRSPDDSAVAINLADVGTGLSQVLPIVVQRLFEGIHDEHESLEIVEQPELHLHPGAHGNLADLYIKAAQQPGMRFIIETHSENFILRIRRRVAEGTLDPNLLRIYWVNDEPRPGSTIETIEVLRSGDVSYWPKGVFSENFEEFKAIRSAQRELERKP